MSGLQNFLAPFSHLLYANRNFFIILLCLVLFLVAVDALLHRWRTARLQTDLSTARSAASNSGARRYVTAQPVEEAPVESGGLPPVKGGRTYARNLGSALHKAGMAAPQIYSPPTPAGWAPSANPAQAAPQQPGMPGPYATPNVPWAAPTQPAPAPWAYPAGANRGVPSQPPIQTPYYQPPAPTQPPQPTAMPQAPAPTSPAPGQYSQPPATFPQPTFPAPTSGPGAPTFATPPPAAPAGAPIYQPPTPAPAGGGPSDQDSARRGKPKRRRFNFNVLENLEKMVQARPAEPLPPIGWTPPATPPAPPAAAQPVPPAASQPAPAADEPASVAKQAEAELPLQFGPPPTTEAAEATQAAATLEPEVVAEPAAAAEEDVEREVSEAQPEVAQPEAKFEPEPQIEPEPEPVPSPSPKAEPRTSMRSMLFGEESYPSSAVKSKEPEPETPAPEPVSTAPEPETTEPSWPSYSWTHDQEPTSKEPEATTPSPTAEEAAVEPTPEPFADSFSSTSFDPWKSTSSFDEPVADAAVSEPSLASAGAPPVPDEADAGGSSAGTVVIIEDDQTAASYYATLFRGNGYRVEVANDGVSGVDLCARVQPQVILLDVMMPRQNGILVLQTLRASDETKNTPVVVMSNFSEPTLIKRALQLGALEYVIKTQVEGPALLNALPRWMNREKAFAAA
jgi:CheY-like chemotaxis protein